MCVLIAAVSLGAVALRLELWKADLRVPFQYNHDSFTNLFMIKTVLDHGWWMENPSVGAPGQFEWHDYPFNPTLHMILIKGMGLFTSDAALILNLYWLLSFPLISLATYAALRAMNITRWPAAAAAVLYAFIHYHFWRNEAHLYLAAYFVVPLVGLLLAWLAKGEPLLLDRSPGGRLRLRLGNRATLLALTICLGMGLDSPYYPIFGGMFLMAAGCLLAGGARDVLPLLRATGLTATVVAGLAINMAPNFAYRYQHGRNPAADHVASSRPWTDCEEYALKLIQLILPAVNHPVPLFSKLRNDYYAKTKVVSGADSLSLGMCASLGLLVALSALFWGQSGSGPRVRLFHLFGTLSVVALLVGTVGGLCVVPGLLGYSMMRCYDRLSIFLALFGLTSCALLLDHLARRWPSGLVWKAIGATALGGFVYLGIRDQATNTYHPPYEVTKQTYSSDSEFVRQTEASLDPGAMVWQLPYISFLSYRNAQVKMMPYDNFRGYFHSKGLHWSFGPMHGRATAALQARIAARPLEEQLRLLVHLGFAAIYVDRHGYKDNGAGIEAELRRRLGKEPLCSSNGRLLLFSLKEHGERLRSQDAGGELAAWAKGVLGSPVVKN